MVSYVVATKVTIDFALRFASLLVGTGLHFDFRLRVRLA
jgi:hypothetical protein